MVKFKYDSFKLKPVHVHTLKIKISGDSVLYYFHTKESRTKFRNAIEQLLPPNTEELRKIAQPQDLKRFLEINILNQSKTLKEVIEWQEKTEKRESQFLNK